MGICASKQYSVPSLRYVATSPSSDPSFPLVGFARGTIVETSAHSGSSPHSNSLEVLHPFSGSAESAVRNDNLAPSQQPPMHGAHSAGSSAPAAEASFALQPGCKTAAAPDITSIPLLSPAISPELCPIARVEVLVRPPASPAAPQPHHADTNLPSLQPQQLSAESKPDSQAARRKATVKCDAAPLASQNLAQPVVAAPRERPKSRLAVSVSMRDLSELTPPTAQARTSPPSPVSQGPAAQPTQHTAQPAATLQPHCPELAAATATAAATLVVHEAASKLWPALPPTPAALPTPSIPAAKGGPAEPGLWVLRRTGDVRNKYIVGEQLGRGQFGVVCIAIDKAKGTRWALKSVSKRRVQGMHDFSMADVLREVEVLYTIGGHPGVVGLREVYEDAEDLHLIMELCQGGDWFEHLIKHGRYTEAEASVVVRSVLEALSYCHSLGIMHRDIKPENIMFEDRSDESAVKLTDFGLAGMFCEGGPRLTEVLGSAYYVAPEVLRESYSKEADIWSLGVVLFIALGGYAPFDGANEREVFTKILHEPLSFKDPSWEGISAEAKAVITSMLTKDPCRRATISELLSHEWLNTCAGTVSPTTCSPRDIFLPPAGSSKAEVVAAPLAARRNMVVCPSFVRRLPKGSIVAAVAAAAAKGKQVRAVPDAVVARLQHFSAMNVFKRQARLVLASLLPEEEVEGLMQVFISMDKDGDGVLSLRELRDALTQRGISTTDKTAKLLLERADLDGSGGVDYLEFLASTVHLARLERDERMWRAFRHFDTADTGFISRENLVQGLAHMGTKVDVDKILAEVDQDGDGKICYNEFCNMASVVDMEMSLECLRHQPEPAALSTFANDGAGGTGAWGAWGEATVSGRFELTMGADSRAPSRPTSLAASRTVSSNERTTGISLRRSLGGNLLLGPSARTSQAGEGSRVSWVGEGSRASWMGEVTGPRSIAGTHGTGSSRFGSMRAAAAAAAVHSSGTTSPSLSKQLNAQAAACAATVVAQNTVAQCLSKLSAQWEGDEENEEEEEDEEDPCPGPRPLATHRPILSSMKQRDGSRSVKSSVQFAESVSPVAAAARPCPVPPMPSPASTDACNSGSHKTSGPPSNAASGSSATVEQSAMIPTPNPTSPASPTSTRPSHRDNEDTHRQLAAPAPTPCPDTWLPAGAPQPTPATAVATSLGLPATRPSPLSKASGPATTSAQETRQAHPPTMTCTEAVPTYSTASPPCAADLAATASPLPCLATHMPATDVLNSPDPTATQCVSSSTPQPRPAATSAPGSYHEHPAASKPAAVSHTRRGSTSAVSAGGALLVASPTSAPTSPASLLPSPPGRPHMPSPAAGCAVINRVVPFPGSEGSSSPGNGAPGLSGLTEGQRRSPLIAGARGRRVVQRG